MKPMKYGILCLTIFLYQLPSSLSVNMGPVSAEDKVKFAEQLREFRENAVSQETDRQIINGGGTTPFKTKDILYDPYTRLKDSKGRPSADWLTSYGGEPFGFEIAFVAVIPLILAKLLRIFRNVFRPNLHLRVHTADFPLVPLIYLQQTKIEERLKRPRRNGIDWLGKKFLIRASDDIVDSMREIQGHPLHKAIPRNPWVLLKLMTTFTAALHHAVEKKDHEHAPGAVYPHHESHDENADSSEAEDLKKSKTQKNVRILAAPKPRLDEPESTTELSSEKKKGTDDTTTQKGGPKVSFSNDVEKEVKEQPKAIESDKEEEGEDNDDDADDEDDDGEGEGDETEIKKGEPRKAPKQKKKGRPSKDKKKRKNSIQEKISFQVISEKPQGGAAEQQGKGKKATGKKPPGWVETPEVGELEPDLPSNLRQLKNVKPTKDSKKKRGRNRDPENPTSPESEDK